MSVYFRPLVQSGVARPADAVPLAGTSLWFTHAERLSRSDTPEIVPVTSIPKDVLDNLCTPRVPISGLDLTGPQIMGILNVTPDSFSDGGRHNEHSAACGAAQDMVRDGATMIDIGGESTRPGADYIPVETEIARTEPVIQALRAKTDIPISIDTRKAPVAAAALAAGANLVNDVSGFTFDSDLGPLCADQNAPVCVMHAQGDPETMQDNPEYDDVLLDVYDFLQQQIVTLSQLGIPKSRIVVDPGIGFGKNLDHNLALLQGLSLFHGLGCAILLGVSRKGFIGKLGFAPQADTRAPGSIAVGLAGLAQGVQILRVHDVAETAQALRLWQAVRP